MYDKIFSSQWIFDRCLEAQALFPLLVILLSITLVLFLNFLLKKGRFERKKQIVIISISSVIIIAMVFISSFILGIFACNASAIWKGVSPALELDEKVKELCLNKSCPKSETELAKIDPILYQQVASNAKSQYRYDPGTKEYVWYVQPSGYYIGVFQKGTFSLYKIPSFISVNHWGGIPTFIKN